MNDERRRAMFEAAREACLTGHQAGCTYGETSAFLGYGYWRPDPDCPLDHGGLCAWCGQATETSNTPSAACADTCTTSTTTSNPTCPAAPAKSSPPTPAYSRSHHDPTAPTMASRSSGS